jgi:hypothetical protein
VALADRDPRHTAAFGAAWVAAYAAAVAGQALSVLALLESHGPNGPLGVAASGTAGTPGQPCLAWQTLDRLAAAAGARIVPVQGAGTDLAALAWTHDGHALQAVVVNLTERPAAWRWADRPDERIELGAYGMAWREWQAMPG